MAIILQISLRPSAPRCLARELGQHFRFIHIFTGTKMGRNCNLGLSKSNLLRQNDTRDAYFVGLFHETETFYCRFGIADWIILITDGWINTRCNNDIRRLKMKNYTL